MALIPLDSLLPPPNPHQPKRPMYSSKRKTRMKAIRAVRIATWHLALYCFVIAYMLAGAFIFHYLEGDAEIRRHSEHKNAIRRYKRQFVELIANQNETMIESHLRHFMENVSRLHISMENYLLFDDPKQTVAKRWTFPSCVLFAFTILTTIGYGNVAPTTRFCQIFTMVYGALGIPLFLITIADVGRFSKTFIMYLVILVAVLFLAFIAAGSAILPLWEDHMTYFDSVYFSYMSLSTIGLGDIVPRRMEFLLPTLIYITIGLWLTTALVEQLADVFRLVHYAGRHVSNVKGITVWLGGRRLSMGSLIQTVCRRVGMSDNIIGQINWDRTIDRALAGEQPPAVPIFPWHFADFVEKDPPLIDLSMDFEEEQNGMMEHDVQPFECKDLTQDILELSNTTANLERVAAHCEVRYHTPQIDQLNVLSETKRLTVQSLASVAGNITNLANNFWNALSIESDNLEARDANLTSLNLVIAIEREKAARREIGRLTAERQGLKENVKCQAPVSMEKAQRYHRCAIDYSILDGLGHGVTGQDPNGPRILVNRTHSMVSGDSVAYMSSHMSSNNAIYERWVPTNTPHGMYAQDTIKTIREPAGGNYAYSTLRRNQSQLRDQNHYAGTVRSRGPSASNYNAYVDNDMLPSPPRMTADTPDSTTAPAISYLYRARVIYDYNAEKPDELNLQVDSIVLVVRKNDDGWHEGVLNGVTGLFPENYVEIIP